MGTGHQKDQAMIRSLEMSSPVFILERRERGWKWSFLPTWRNLHKIPIVQCSGSLQVGEHIHTGRRLHSSSMGTEAPAPGTLPDLALCIPSFGCSSVYLIISFNKLVNVNVSLSSVSGSSKLNLRRRSQEPPFFSQIWQKLWETWGPTTCDWHLKWGGSSLVGLSP